MIRQLEQVQYEPGQTDEDGVELRKKKPKSFRRKLKEVLRRAKEDEALLQDFTEYLVVVRPDKMILKRVGDVARDEPPPPVRAASRGGRGGRHHGARRPPQQQSAATGADDVFFMLSQAETLHCEAAPPAAPWSDAGEEPPFSPRYAVDSPASTASASASAASASRESPPSRESLVEFISRHSQRPRLEARRRCRPPTTSAATPAVEGSTLLPPAQASPGQSHDSVSQPVEAPHGDGQTPPPPANASPVQSPDSTQAGERPAAGYDVSRYTENITPEPQAANGSPPSAPTTSPTLSTTATATTATAAAAGDHTRSNIFPGGDDFRSNIDPAVDAAGGGDSCSDTKAGNTDIEYRQLTPGTRQDHTVCLAPLAAAVTAPSPPLSPPEVTIRRVSGPPRTAPSPPSAASRQLLKRPAAGGQTQMLPLKKRRLETAEQKAQRSLLLEAARGPQLEELPRRARRLDMALVRGYEFLFQPGGEEHSITRVLNPSYDPALALPEPLRPAAAPRGLPCAGGHQPAPPPPPQQQQQPQQPRPHRPRAAGGPQARGAAPGLQESAAPSARQPRLPLPPLPGPYASVLHPLAVPPHAMSPSVHALFEAYERVSRRAEPSDRRAFRLYEPVGQERHPPPPPSYNASWHHQLRLQQQQQQQQHQRQQQQQMELHQQWLQHGQQERHYNLQREQHHQAQQQHQQQQHQHQQLQQQHQLQHQLQHQEQQQHQPHHQHHEQQRQLQQQFQHQQQHHQQQQQQQQQQKRQHRPHKHQQPQQQAHQHQQPQQLAQQPPHKPPPAVGPLAGTWGAAWCPEDAVAARESPQSCRLQPGGASQPVPHRPAACYPPYAEYPALRRHVYPSLGEPWAPVGPAVWPPRPGAL